MRIRCGCRDTRAASRRRCIGKWLKSRGNRDKVLIATKLGVEVVPGEQGLSRQYMQKAVERSLQRLNTDYIDLYQSHRDDAEHAHRGDARRVSAS